MNRDLVEIYNAIIDLKLQLPESDSIATDFNFPEIVVVGGQSNGKIGVFNVVKL